MHTTTRTGPLGPAMIAALLLAAACGDDGCPAGDEPRQLYFGDLHAHSAVSFDAWGYQVRTTPDEAYAFARGAAVLLAPLDEQGNGTRTAQLDRPL